MTEADQKRKLGAIMSADVVGYSRLMQDDDAATVETLTKYRAIFSHLVERHDGRIVDSPGDNILAEFDSAVEAVQCAVEIQRDIGRQNMQLADHRKMEFRIGINLGDVITKKDGTIYGDGVNIAARLEGLAEPGGICLSETVFLQTEGKIDNAFEDIGAHEVKNIVKPVRTYRVVTDLNAAPVRPAPERRFPVALVAVGVAIAAIAGVGFWQLSDRPAVEQPVAIDARDGQTQTGQDSPLELPSGASIAVLPFTNIGGDPEQEYFADGISEELITALARFHELHVIARNSSFQYKGQAVDIKKVGRELGARFVLEGSVRKAAQTIRVTAQLLTAEDGTHLWAETYERDLSAASIFEIQDEITEQVVGMIAGSYGIIARAGYEQAKRKGTDNMASFDCVLRLYAYRQVMSSDGHLQMRDCLERAVETDPDYADAWAWLSWIYVMERSSKYNPRPNSFERGLNAAQRAVEIDPTSGVTRLALARAYFYLRELDLFLKEAEQAVALSPNNSDVLITSGYYVALAGEWDRGIALVREAMTLNPSYPGWAHDPMFWDYFRNGDYESALAEAKMIAKLMPKTGYGYAFQIAAFGQLGRNGEARPLVAKFLEIEPELVESAPETWLLRNIPQETIDRYRNGLDSAGLDTAISPAAVN